MYIKIDLLNFFVKCLRKKILYNNLDINKINYNINNFENFAKICNNNIFDLKTNNCVKIYSGYYKKIMHCIEIIYKSKNCLEICEEILIYNSLIFILRHYNIYISLFKIWEKTYDLNN